MRHKFKFLFILIPVAFLTVATFATMGLWNWLMPPLFGFGTLTFLKALGIFALSRLFFGGRAFGGWRRHRFAYVGHHHSQHRADWQQKMQDKWQNMSDDDRANFSARCGKRFNFDKEEKSDGTNA